MTPRQIGSFLGVIFLLTPFDTFAEEATTEDKAKIEAEAAKEAEAIKMAEEAAKEAEKYKTYVVTAPGARNPFPVKLLDKMRKELMRQAGMDVKEDEKAGEGE